METLAWILVIAGIVMFVVWAIALLMAGGDGP